MCVNCERCDKGFLYEEIYKGHCIVCLWELLQEAEDKLEQIAKNEETKCATTKS